MTARCAKPSRCWARPGQSWAHHNIRKDQDKRRVQVRRGKNPRQGEILDKTKTKKTVQLRTSKIHKTRRQAGGLAYPHVSSTMFVFCNESQNSAISWRATSLEIVARQKCCRSMGSCGAILSSWMLCTRLWGWTSPEIMLLRAESVEPKKLMLAGGKCQIQSKEEAIGDIPFPPASPAQGLSEVTLF